VIERAGLDTLCAGARCPAHSNPRRSTCAGGRAAWRRNRERLARTRGSGSSLPTTVQGASSVHHSESPVTATGRSTRSEGQLRAEADVKGPRAINVQPALRRFRPFSSAVAPTPSKTELSTDDASRVVDVDCGSSTRPSGRAAKRLCHLRTDSAAWLASGWPGRGASLAGLWDGHRLRPHGYRHNVGFHRFHTQSFKTSAAMRVLFAVLGSRQSKAPVGSTGSPTTALHQPFSDRPGDPHSPHLESAAGWKGAFRACSSARRMLLRATTPQRLALRAPRSSRRPGDAVDRPDLRGWVPRGIADSIRTRRRSAGHITGGARALCGRSRSLLS